jgi:hypothetical protein
MRRLAMTFAVPSVTECPVGGNPAGRGSTNAAPAGLSGTIARRLVRYLSSVAAFQVKPGILWSEVSLTSGTLLTLLIGVTQAAFANRPCGSSTNLAAMPWSNAA